MKREFRPLDMLRQVRGDKTLSATEKGLLVFAVLRTDNETRRVRASLRLLAEDAGLGYRTARRAFEPTSYRVLRYFERVERRPRAVDLTFAYPGGVAASEKEATMAPGEYRTLEPKEVIVSPSAVTVTGSGGQGGHPSAISSATSSASTALTWEWIEANAPSFDDDPVETVAVYHTEGHERPMSNLPDWKQRQLWEESLAQEEGLDRFGEPLPSGGSGSSWARRSQS